MNNFGAIFYDCPSLTVLVKEENCKNLIEKIKGYVKIEYKN